MCVHERVLRAVLLAALVLVFARPEMISAATRYLPDVTAAMAKPGYWSAKEPAPGEVLASAADIARINKDIVAGKGTGVWDMSTWSTETFNGIERAQTLKKAAQDDAEYSYSGLGAKYLNGEALSHDEAMAKLYGPLIENCVDPAATASMPVGFAICTTRTTLRSFPTDQPLPDDPSDADFDVLHLTAVSVGEPLILRGKSADGKYFSANTSYLSGWIPASDVAICANRAEWLTAWHFPDSSALVVTADKIYTEASNSTPETAGRMLTMGVRLQLADRASWSGKIGNRYAYNNYVVWMPVRRSDGSFERQLALISEHCSVSEGVLPLTAENLAEVMFNQLGNTYGWGGMLQSQDCSGYVRDVYRCFGLELGRNTTNQIAQPVRKYNLEGMTDEEKLALIRELPLGAELLFSGHAMLYLGCEKDKLYVISSVSNLVADGVKLRVRGAVINTLNITRANGRSWLNSLSTATVPWLRENPVSLSGASVKGLKTVTYTGEAQMQKPKVKLSGTVLKENVDYTLSWSDNTEAGTAAVTVTGRGKYSGTVKKTFKIRKAKKSVSVVLDKDAYTYTGKAVTPKYKVLADGEELKADAYTATLSEGRKQVGTYRVSVKLTGSCSGSASAAFQIVPKGTVLLELTGEAQGITVRWKAQKAKMGAAGITGYRIQYATNKEFTTGLETVTVKGKETAAKKIGQLRRNKTYYVRIGTYMKAGSRKYYSGWSEAKVVVTK